MLLATLIIAASPAVAQTTAADSAGILLEAAQQLESEGQRDAADALLRYIIKHYAGTPAASDAGRQLTEIRQRVLSGSGRGELMVWYTVYGAWLGVAVPAALGADEPEPYGVGLLVGAPIGFLAAKAYARTARLTSGQARAIDFGSQWGTWQGVGWRAVLDLGTHTEVACFGPGGSPPCDTFESTSDEAPWTAMVVGGLTGMTAAALLARGRNIPSGRATFAIHGAYWGTWYGLASAILFDTDGDDETLRWVLLGGNIGLFAAALGGPDGMTSGRSWLITAGGVGGLAAGFGLDLLLQPDDDQTAIAIPMALSALGLALAAHWTRKFTEDHASRDGLPRGSALVSIRAGRLSLGVPAVVPTRLPGGHAATGKSALAWNVPLFELRHR